MRKLHTSLEPRIKVRESQKFIKLVPTDFEIRLPRVVPKIASRDLYPRYQILRQISRPFSSIHSFSVSSAANHDFPVNWISSSTKLCACRDVFRSQRRICMNVQRITQTAAVFINSIIKCVPSPPLSRFLVMRSRQLARFVALVRLVLYFRNGSWILYACKPVLSHERSSLAICLLQYSRHLGREPRVSEEDTEGGREGIIAKNGWNKKSACATQT